MKNIKATKVASVILATAIFLSACATSDKNEENEIASNDAQVEASNAAKTNEKIKISHELGEVTLDTVPENIVVFDYGTLDMLDALDIPIKGLPKSNIPAYLEKFNSDEYTNVGSLKEPDFETIYEMAPDIIFISGRASGAYEELSKIAPTIYLAVDPEDYMGSMEHNSSILGQIFDKDEEVKEKIESLKNKANDIKAKAETEEKEALIILTNDGAISAYGKNSRFGIIHSSLGFKEVDEEIEMSTHGQNVSFEYILEKNPKTMYVIDRAQVVGGEVTASKTLENELIMETQAYKDENIFYLDPMIWYISSGGFMSTELMLEEISKTLN